MSDLKVRPLKEPRMQRRRAGHPANPRTQTEVCATKPKAPTSQGGPYKTWSRRKSRSSGPHLQCHVGIEDFRAGAVRKFPQPENDLDM